MNWNVFARTVFMSLAFGVLCGCSSTYPSRHATPSGFLGDYSQLKKGKDALLVFVDPKADFKKYDKIMMDPVQVYASKRDSGMAKLSKEDRQRLVNYLDAVLRRNLEMDHTLVDKPGPDVMRLRVAITEVKGAKVVLDTISTLVPVGLAISEVKNLATGSNTAVGKAGIECEGLDSQTGKRLFAAVDERVGRKVTGKFDKFKKFRTAEDAFDYWAEWIRLQLNAAQPK